MLIKYKLFTIASQIMRNLFILFFLFLISGMPVFSQVAINTDGSLHDTSAMLDVKSDSLGMLMPRMTMQQRDLILLPATGLMIFQTDSNPGFITMPAHRVHQSGPILAIPVRNGF